MKQSAGADRGFFLGGGALVSCSTSTPINHIYIYRIYSINRPGRLLNLLDRESGHLFEVGAYSRLGAY